jgi:hypothetical protein
MADEILARQIAAVEELRASYRRREHEQATAMEEIIEDLDQHVEHFCVDVNVREHTVRAACLLLLFQYRPLLSKTFVSGPYHVDVGTTFEYDTRKVIIKPAIQGKNDLVYLAARNFRDINKRVEFPQMLLRVNEKSYDLQRGCAAIYGNVPSKFTVRIARKVSTY